MKVKNYKEFLKERESIRIKKQNGSSFPWTDDEVLQSYHFCNVDRVHDKGTVKLLEVLKDKEFRLQVLIIFVYRISSSGNLVLNMMKNLSEEEIIDLISKNDIQFNKGNVAYQFNPYEEGMTLQRFFKEYIFNKFNSLYSLINSYYNKDLESATDDILDIIDYKRRLKFLVHQIVADISIISNKIDKNSKCYIGTGAVNALKILNTDIETLKKEVDLNYLQLEHSLCEYWKYVSHKDKSKIIRKKYISSKIIKLF